MNYERNPSFLYIFITFFNITYTSTQRYILRDKKYFVQLNITINIQRVITANTGSYTSKELIIVKCV